MQNTVTDLPESTDMKSDEDDDVGDIIHRVVQIQNIPLFRNYTIPMRDIKICIYIYIFVFFSYLL